MCESSALTFITHSAAETRALGVRLGQKLQAGQLVALHGDLGAGKTTLTQGIVVGLGSADRVTSPTFTLVNEYHGRAGLPIIHMDGYRLGQNAVREAEASGLDELLDDAEAVIIVEWPERVAGLLPPDHLSLCIYWEAAEENTRRIECTAGGPVSASILHALASE